MAALTVTIDQGLQTTIESEHHTWHSDELIENGGTGTAADPVEQLLGSVGSCMAITVQLYAKRKGWPLEGMEIHLNLERFKADQYPAYSGDAQFVTEIREHIVLIGNQLTDEQRARLLEISTKCPVRRILLNPTFFVASHGEPITGS
jgi:putative redox protein